MIIIGITGTIGAGKGTIVEYLVFKYGFKHFSGRQFISEELGRRGLENNRDNQILVANDLRAKHSPSFIAEELYKQALENTQSDRFIIESLRTIGEIEALRSKNEPFYLFAVDADQKIRYERIIKRKSINDSVTFEKFSEQEKVEMYSTDPNKQNLTACINLADYVFKNDDDLETLHYQIDEVMTKLLR